MAPVAIGDAEVKCAAQRKLDRDKRLGRREVNAMSVGLVPLRRRSAARLGSVGETTPNVTVDARKMITDETGAQAVMHGGDGDHLPDNDRHH